MKLISILLLLSFSVFGKLTEDERSHLRQMSLTFCSCRGGTFFIGFDKDKPQARVFCRNNETHLFFVKDKYLVCK